MGSDVPAESTVRGINPSRASTAAIRLSLIISPFSIRAKRFTPLVPQTGQDFMVRVLREAPEPVTLMVTGPLTTVAAALDTAPEIESKIKEIVWMGCAQCPW